MPSQRDTRTRIVEAATELFHRRGFQGTSLAAVVERAGVRSGSLYYFFKTKEELLRAALERYGELLQPAIMEPAFALDDDPIERVFLVLGRYRALLLKTDFGLGCPIGNLAIEMIEAGPEVRAGIAADFEGWAESIERCLDAAADRLPADVNRRRLSRFVLTVMEGAVLLARGHLDIGPFDDAVTQLRDYFGRLTDDRDASAGSPLGGRITNEHVRGGM